MRKPGWQNFFHALETVIIDEAHNFASSDRGGHLLALLERLEDGVGRRLQRIAVSATIGNPESMCQWLTGVGEPAKRIHVPTTHVQNNNFLIHHFDDRYETEETPLSERSGIRLLDMLTSEVKGKRGITFVRSRSKSEDFAKAIQQYSKNRIKVRTHHSAVSKFFREEAEYLIQQAGEQGIETIISTSTLELGIDIGELDRVIQIGALASPSAFLQRVGRTGRRPGVPRYFRGITQDEKELLLIAATVSLGMEHKSEFLRLYNRAFHLLAHQIVCLALQNHGITTDKTWRILSSSYAFSGIHESEYHRLVEHMLAEEYLRMADGVIVPGRAAEERYLINNWRKLFAAFSTAPLYEVHEGRNQVGTLDTTFVEGLEAPFFFTLAGRLWKAEYVDFDSHIIKASRAKDGVAPKWESFGGPDVPLETAQRVGEFLHGYRPLPDVLSEPARHVLEPMCRKQPVESDWSPNSLECQCTGGGKALIVTYAGDTMNRTLARLIESRGLNAAGNYASIIVKKGPADSKVFREELMQFFIEIAEAKTISPLMDVLKRRQKAWPFSPFEPMLSEDLTRETLVDQTTNLRGLQQFLAERLDTKYQAEVMSP